MWIPRTELEEVLGEEQARTFLGLCGGRSLYIPKRVRGDSLLVQRAGIETAEKLSQTYAGLTVELPSPHARKTVKHEIIELLRDGELSLSEIAFMLRVTTRYVEIVKRAWTAGELGTYS